MKKLTLTSVVACLVALATFGQAQAQSTKPSIGIKAGMDLMTLGSASDNGISINYKYRPGFQAGLYGDLPITEKVSFMPQLLYTQKGGNINTTITAAGTSVKFDGHTSIDYIDVPLIFAFKPQSNLNLYIGPQVAFFMSQRSEITATDGTTTASDSNSDSDGLRKVLIGGNIGIGYNITRNAGIDLNYVFDLMHTASQNDTGERNSGFALSVRYSF